jgi:site-specific recombinase XerD
LTEKKQLSATFLETKDLEKPMKNSPFYNYDRAIEKLERAYEAKDKALTKNAPERINEYWKEEALTLAREALALARYITTSKLFAPNSPESIKMTEVIAQTENFKEEHLSSLTPKET